MADHAKQNQASTSVEDRGQLSSQAAEFYEEYFVPAVFQQWTDRVADAARIEAGQRVLDVATGTGVLARTAAERVGQAGSVVGLDINGGLLAVARRRAPHIEWRQGRAEALPFEDDNFDAVVSQFGLMFFEDKAGALREMMRVLRPGGRLAVAVWDLLEHSPGPNELVRLLNLHISSQAADALRTPFNLGDMLRLHDLFEEAGIPDARIGTHAGTAHYPSVESWVLTNVKGWVLADLVDESQYALLIKEAESALARYTRADGSLAFDAPAHIVAASKPGSNGRNP